MPAPAAETDPRFPSGPWTGFFLDKRMPGRHQMEMSISFREGLITAAGRDVVGNYLFSGRYFTENGQCHWTKRYLGRHDVFYRGYNEGRGIWGTWEITLEGLHFTGGFHIWPEGESDPTGSHLAESLDVPVGELSAVP